MNIEYLIIISYFSIIIGIGIVFKKTASSSVSSYFRGGGKMLWWMVGSTMFMTQFSAWTFTGAAGKAFISGFPVIAVFVGNVIGFGASYYYFAAKYRQTRLDTGGEIVRARFGRVNEQFFTWLTVPLSVVSGGLWLNSLAVFVSALTKVDVDVTIFSVGLLVLVLSIISGSWGVVASDFIQMLIVASLSIMAAIVALVKIGGPANLVHNMPYDFWMGKDQNYLSIIIASFLFFVVKQIQTNNTMFSSYRYLAAEDSKAARKGALLAMFLMVVGIFVWFLPPWASAILYPDAAEYYTDVLGSRAKDGVFLVFAERAMPAGTIGLLIACLFGATMSSMDSALNRDSGIIIKSFYKVVVNPQADDKRLVKMGYIVTAIIGLLIIGVAEFYLSLKTLSLFDLAMQVGTLVQAPMLVPLFFGLFIRKTPDWAGWSSVIVGAFVSILISTWLTVPNMADWLGIKLTGAEVSNLKTTWNIFAQLMLTGGYFCATSLFYKPTFNKERTQEISVFENNLSKEVFFQEEHQTEVHVYRKEQYYKLGITTLIVGIGISSICLLGNPLWGRIVILSCGLAVSLIGYLLYNASKLENQKIESNKHS